MALTRKQLRAVAVAASLVCVGSLTAWWLHCGRTGALCGDPSDCRAGACVYGVCVAPEDTPANDYLYSARWHDDSARMRRLILRGLRLRSGMRVADIGAGQGVVTQAALDRVGPSGHVYATDIDPRAVAGLRALAQRCGATCKLTPVAVHAPRDTGLGDVPDGSLDRVCMINSLSFQRIFGRAADRTYLATLRAKLKPEGELWVHVDVLEPWERGAASMAALLREAGYGYVAQVPMPADIPAAVPVIRVGGWQGTLRRGFVLVARPSAGRS